MSTGLLTINLGALVANWQALDAMSDSQTETAAVVKANGYGLGAPSVGRSLAKAGARTFFVAVAQEGAILRTALGSGPTINVFSGHMAGDTNVIRDADLVPMINSVDQMLRHVEALPGAPFGLQLDTGMNRLGMEPSEWSALRDIALAQNPTVLMSHLACADEPDHPMNAHQLNSFREMTEGLDIPRSLAATGGTLMGDDYHFDMTRPGIGLYGGLPFAEGRSVISLDIPVIQLRDVAVGETVGYGNAWTAQRPTVVATISAGYADGLIRALGAGATLYAGEQHVPVIGRVSMDLITVDVTDLAQPPETLQLLGQYQSVDKVAGFADTIGYEILTSLGKPIYPELHRMKWLAAIGRPVIGLLAAIGRVTLFAMQTVHALVRAPFYLREFGITLLNIGWLSLPVVGLTAVFTGGALALQIYAGGARFNAEAVVPQIVAIGMVRELGPVLVGLMIAARVTSSIAAEIATMKVTEQIDALVTLSTHPMQYLTVPRVLAATLVVPILVAVGDVIGIFGGYAVATGTLGFNSAAYIRNTVDFLELRDVVSSLAKGGVFGFVAATMGCYYGMNSGRGAQGVGRATKGSVEAAAVLILAANFVLTGVFFSI